MLCVSPTTSDSRRLKGDGVPPEGDETKGGQRHGLDSEENGEVPFNRKVVGQRRGLNQEGRDPLSYVTITNILV